MNKNDLVAAVADSAGLTKADAAKAVDAVFDNISSALKGGSEVRLVGFGTFAAQDSRRAALEVLDDSETYVYMGDVENEGGWTRDDGAVTNGSDDFV